MLTELYCAVACLTNSTIPSCMSNPSTLLAPHSAAKQVQSPDPHPMSSTFLPKASALRNSLMLDKQVLALKHFSCFS